MTTNYHLPTTSSSLKCGKVILCSYSLGSDFTGGNYATTAPSCGRASNLLPFEWPMVRVKLLGRMVLLGDRRARISTQVQSRRWLCAFLSSPTANFLSILLYADVWGVGLCRQRAVRVNGIVVVRRPQHYPYVGYGKPTNKKIIRGIWAVDWPF